MNSYISSYSISSALRQSILTAQSNLATAEQEVSTGLYADVGLTLGASTAYDLSLHSQETYLQTIADTNNAASTRLSSTQNVLDQLRTTAQNFLQTLISASSGDSTAGALQSEAQNALQALTSELNTDFNGQYIFAGINSGAAPVTNYYGTSAANRTAVANAFQSTFGFLQSSASVSTVTGSQMQSFLNTQFAALFQGSNWTSDWSMASSTTISTQISDTQTVSTSVSANDSAFQELAQAYTMVADLGTQNLSSGALDAVVQTATSLVQSGITDLTAIQTNVGAVQNDITTANSQMSVQMNIFGTQVNTLETVDTYQVSTQVTSLQTQIETAYSLTAQLQKLSLVNYI